MFGPSWPNNSIVFEREKIYILANTCLVLLAGKFEGALSRNKYEVLYRTVYIDSALVGLVGRASMSDFSVVYATAYSGSTVKL